MSWVCQAPGKWLEWIGQINENCGSICDSVNVKGRFTISRDKEKDTLYLQMRTENWGHGHLYYLCRTHSVWTSVWAQTHTSLKRHTGSAEGTGMQMGTLKMTWTQDHPHEDVQRVVMGWFPPRVQMLHSIKQIKPRTECVQNSVSSVCIRRVSF
jgi:hypothetical protein